jgi:hypothetical protein
MIDSAGLGIPKGYLHYLGGEGSTVGEWMIADHRIDYRNQFLELQVLTLQITLMFY